MDVILFISALVAYISCVEGDSACTTPTGRRGECISIYSCDPLLALLGNTNRTDQDIDTIRKSKCGLQKSLREVCCPSECFTIEGQLGTCIGIKSCPHLNELVSPSITAETVSYIQRSRCEGLDEQSVCCGQSVNLGPIKKNNTCIPSAAPPDPRTECCGLESSVNDRIIGGSVTNIDQYPWLALIEYTKGPLIKLLCGGTLISGKYVLTAGHCVLGSVLSSGIPSKVRLGEYDTSYDGGDCANTNGGGLDCNNGTVVISIDRTIPHPDYNPESNLNRHDIALLRLNELAPYTDFIRPISLPTSNLAQNYDKMFVAAGWGAVNETVSKSTVKLQVKLPFVSLEKCQIAYNTPPRNVPLWKGQLCAGGKEGQDTCKGDSGGPLMFQRNDGTWEVAGVVSFGPRPCGLKDIPGVYTNVYHYIPWMRSQIRP